MKANGVSSEVNGDKALDALGDATRRSIFRRVALRPSAVGELAAGLPVSRPAVSQHLKVLKDAGLVLDHAEGTRRVYQINPDAMRGLHAYLDSFWSDSLAAFKAAAEVDPKPNQDRKGRDHE